MESLGEVLKRVGPKDKRPGKRSTGIQPLLTNWKQRRMLVVSKDVLLEIDDDGSCAPENHVGGDLDDCRFHRYRDADDRLYVRRCPKGLNEEERMVRMVEDIPNGHAKNCISAVLATIRQANKAKVEDRGSRNEAAWGGKE